MLILPIAGGGFHCLYRASGGLAQGMRLRLVREDNRHDEWCTGIYLTAEDLVAAEMEIPVELEGDPRPRWRLGYIPQKTTQPCWSALVGPALDRGALIDCFFHGFDDGSHALVRLEGDAADEIRLEGERLEADREAKHREWLLDCEVRLASEQVWGRDSSRRGYDWSSRSFEQSLEERRARRIEDVKIACGIYAKRERDRLRRRLRRTQALFAEASDVYGQALLSEQLSAGEAEAVKQLLQINRAAQQAFAQWMPEKPTRRSPRKRNERGYFDGDPADPGPPAWDDDEIPF